MEQNYNQAINKKGKQVILLIIFLAIIFSIFGFLIYKNSFLKIGSAENDLQNLIQNATETVKAPQIFYYTEGNSQQDGQYQYKIFKASEDITKVDEKTHSFSLPERSRVITDSWQKNKVLFILNYYGSSKSFIYVLDVSLQNSQPKILLEFSVDAKKGEGISDARIVDGGASLAYITAEGMSDSAKHSVLHIFSIADRQEKENYLLSEQSPLYAGFGFLEATPDDKIIFLRETGGDGPASWSQWYKLNRDIGIVQKIEKIPPYPKYSLSEGSSPVVADFNSDRTMFIYADFSSAPEESDLDIKEYEERGGALSPCLKFWGSDAMKRYQSEGGVIMVYDFKAGTSSEVFRNLSYSDNICMNIARRIIAVEWLDDSNIVFETIDGVYKLDLKTKKQDQIFLFERTFYPGQQTRPWIVNVQLPYIFFSDHSIADVNSNKLLYLLSPDAQKGNFFFPD